MSYVLLAVSVCLIAQAPGGADDFQPIQPRTRRAAPPADFGDAARQAPAAQPAVQPGWPDYPAADPEPPADWASGGVQQQPVRQRPAQRQPPAQQPVQQDPQQAMQPVGQEPPQRLRPPELIAEALENPSAGALVGTPLTLSQALAGAADRNQQLAITKAYWRLATAQADYHWALEQRDLLRDQTRTQTNQPGTLSARAAARAEVRAAQLAVEQAQADLGLMLGSGERATPLASDRPHVGDYRTNYQDIFGARNAPPKLRLVNRTLPVRRKAIDAHAEAIVAALDAVQATGEQFQSTGQGLATLLDAIELLKHERKAFIAEVRQYNLDIADYAFAVAPNGAPSQTLVSMLIRTTPAATARDQGRPADPTTPQLRKTFRREPNPGPLPNERTSTSEVQSWTMRYAEQPDQGWYEALLELSSQPMRVQKLSNLLHWDRNLPSEAGRPTSLAEALRDVPPQNRLAAIEAFWKARERAAEVQFLYDQLDQLASLRSLAMPRSGGAGAAEAAVRLQAARRSTQASLFHAQAELMTAQSNLLVALGRPNDIAWIMPATPPQSGRYLVSTRARRGYARGAKWADRITLQYDKLQHRADALMQCDAHRASLVRAASAGEAPAGDQLTTLDGALWAVRRQNHLARGFLRDLTEYNMAIANYAILTLPESVSGEQLAGKLAIPRSTVRDS